MWHLGLTCGVVVAWNKWCHMATCKQRGNTTTWQHASGENFQPKNEKHERHMVSYDWRGFNLNLNFKIQNW